jgi:hypothetical protein
VHRREGGVGDLPVERRPLGAIAGRFRRAEPLTGAGGRRAYEGSERHERKREQEEMVACGEHLAQRGVAWSEAARL